MKRLLSSTALAVFSFATAPALAETSFGEGFTIDGHVGLSYFGGGTEEQTYFSTDGTLAWSNGTFGVELGLIGLAADGENATALFPTLSYTFGNGGKVSVGAPRPAYDEYAKFAVNDLSDLFGTANLAANGKSLVTTFLVLSDAAAIYGVRYDGSANNLAYAVSYHQDEDQVGYLLSSSAAWQSGQLTVSGGIDHLDFFDVSGGGNVVKLRGDYDWGKFAAGLGVISVIPEGNGSEEVYEASLTYKPTDKIALTGVFANQSLFGDNLSGVVGSYSFTENASARASVFKPSDTSDTMWEVGVRYSF